MSLPQPTVNVTIKTLNEVLNYLAARPYAEVTKLISSIHSETLPQVQPMPTLVPAPVNTTVENATQEKSA